MEVPTPTDEDLQAVLRKIITRAMKLLTVPLRHPPGASQRTRTYAHGESPMRQKPTGPF